jgi:hypothetical protein
LSRLDNDLQKGLNNYTKREFPVHTLLKMSQLA